MAWPDGVFIPMSLEALAAPRDHIHDCAMLVLNMDNAEAQSAICDYIIENPNVPLFMLNRVPDYALGYKRALNDQFLRCEKHECICCGMGNNG